VVEVGSRHRWRVVAAAVSQEGTIIVSSHTIHLGAVQTAVCVSRTEGARVVEVAARCGGRGRSGRRFLVAYPVTLTSPTRSSGCRPQAAVC